MEGILSVVPACKCTEHGVLLESLTAIVKVKYITVYYYSNKSRNDM